MTEKDRPAEILGLANIVIAYRQVWPEDLALLVRLLFPANIRFD